jgi:exonuclease SbcC
MIKIKKILIENFRGIKSPTEVDFHSTKETLVNILSGANGFGKTTIFDAIEVCLTGMFHRIFIFDNVQKKTANKSKPFYQNLDGHNVILRLWVEKIETNESFIIIKYYDDDKSPKMVYQGRENIPSDSNNFFTTFLTDDSQYFYSSDFSKLKPVLQKQIDELFYGTESDIQLLSTYYLFNYIQQEDCIYFLRQNEDEKGKSLGFLFNIENEENKKEKLSTLVDILAVKYGNIRNEIDTIKVSIPDSKKAGYTKLFEEMKFDLDSETPFLYVQNPKEKLNEFESKINALIDLKENFDIKEYEKSIQYKKLNEEVIDNFELMKSLILKKVYSSEAINRILVKNNKIYKASSFIKKENKNVLEKEYFDLFILDENVLTRYQEIEKRISSIDIDLGEYGKMISELNASRGKSLLEFEKLKSANLIDENKCPLCNTSFDSFEALLSEIIKKTESLSEYNNLKLDEKRKLLLEIEKFAKQIEENAQNFLKNNKLINKDVIACLRAYLNYENKVSEILKLYPSIESPELIHLYFTEIPESISPIEENAEAIKQFVIQKILPAFQYDDQLIQNKHLYSEYFGSSPEIFKKITVDQLKNKLDYLRNSYAITANVRLKFLEGRLEKLDKLKRKTETIYNRVYSIIKDYKADMISKIKIPFYIYSGKILQSYQQGLGIFVEIHPTGQSNYVRFKTGNSSDHDIVYHLSSGQMAVVSLAFCLSLNKVYNTNQHFKFLAIDDPIQNMDDLNIHTFIELLRNEFNEYQLIMSTHDDFTSRYMKYKFDKFGMRTKIQNVQQLVIEQFVN